MTPEVRAARDRIAAFADRAAWPDAKPLSEADAVAVISGHPDAPRLYKSDLRLVLAALDQHEAHLETVRQDIRQVAAEAGFAPRTEPVEITYTPAKPFVPQNGDRTLCGACAELIEFIDPHDGHPGIWRHVEMPTDCTHYGPGEPQTSDDSTPKGTP